MGAGEIRIEPEGDMPKETKKKSRRKGTRRDPLSDLAEARGAIEDLGAEETREDALIMIEERATDWSSSKALQTLREVASSFTPDLGQRALMRRILHSAVRSLNAERGILFLGRGDETGLVPVVALNIRGQELIHLERVSRTIVNRGRLGEILITPDAMADSRFKDVPSVQVKQIRSALCAPLYSQGKSVGVIYLDSPSRRDGFPFDVKPFLEAFTEVAALAIENARLYHEIQTENHRLRRRLDFRESSERVVAASPRMEALLERALLAAQTEKPVLILGERGTGKELVARMIHDAGSRALGPFLSLDCGAAPPIFFTELIAAGVGVSGLDAATVPDLWARAENGTLYLSGIGALEPKSRGRLCDILEQGIRRDRRKAARGDVRFLLASNKTLQADPDFERFRWELIRRTDMLELQVPALRERREDIPVLVAHFLRKHAAVRGPVPADFTEEAMDRLQSYDWPGNVAELETAIRRVIALARSSEITGKELDRILHLSPRRIRAEAAGMDSRTDGVRLIKVKEREAIEQALIQARGNKAKAAGILGLHRNTLNRKIGIYRIEPKLYKRRR
jgi:DNA-binding NtrC family response regulator